MVDIKRIFLQAIIDIEQGVARLPQWRLAAPVDFRLYEGEHIAIVGPNGSGKTFLADMIAGRHPLLPRRVSGSIAPGDLDNPRYYFGDCSEQDGGSVPMQGETRHNISDCIKYISFRDAYGGDTDRNYYHQQRWNQMDIAADTPTARERLELAFLRSGADSPGRRVWQSRVYTLFGMESFLDKYIILLSSGELRKLRLAEALFSEPRVLIMDNPFIGLDAPTRDQLLNLLTALSRDGTVQIMLILPRYDEIPAFITHVVEMKAGIALTKRSREDFVATRSTVPAHVLGASARQAILDLPSESLPDARAVPEVIRLRDVGIVYSGHTLLKNLNWTVRRGEKWVLTGRNGSGKSTLLSLVCADNPQSYACDIELFGRRRGSGESIWDIKRQIGYVSPEMHRAYRENVPALRIVASGLSDFGSIHARLDEDGIAMCHFWMRIFGIDHLADRPFLSLSDGEQRLMLVARAFVRDPVLLVLDEPLHGLDLYRCRLVLDVIDTFCSRPGKTLVMVTHVVGEVPGCVSHSLELCAP